MNMPPTKEDQDKLTQRKNFLTLCRLRQGFKEEHLSHLYGISQTTVSRITISWVNFAFESLQCGHQGPKLTNTCLLTSSTHIHLPGSLSTVPRGRTEIPCQRPKRLRLNSKRFSSYKNHATLKGLVGISPGGAITFINQLYTGHISDRETATRSGFLNLLFDGGDSVMADKGFTVEDLRTPLGVSLNIDINDSNRVSKKAIWPLFSSSIVKEILGSEALRVLWKEVTASFLMITKLSST